MCGALHLGLWQAYKSLCKLLPVASNPRLQGLVFQSKPPKARSLRLFFDLPRGSFATQGDDENHVHQGTVHVHSMSLLQVTHLTPACTQDAVTTMREMEVEAHRTFCSV